MLSKSLELKEHDIYGNARLGVKSVLKMEIDDFPVTGSSTGFLATIHVHLNGTNACGVDRNIGYFPTVTLNKPTLIMLNNSEKNLSAIIGRWNSRRISAIKWGYLNSKDFGGATVNRVFYGFSLIQVLKSHNYSIDK